MLKKLILGLGKQLAREKREEGTVSLGGIGVSGALANGVLGVGGPV